jgi:hypothetical protein
MVIALVWATYRSKDISSIFSKSSSTTTSPINSVFFGTWRDQINRDRDEWVQYELCIDSYSKQLWADAITEAGKVRSFGPLTITDYGNDYVSAGGYTFTYSKKTDTIVVNSSMFNPPFERYYSEVVNNTYDENSNNKSTPKPANTSIPATEKTSFSDSIFNGTWRDQVYREGKDWIQYELVIDCAKNQFWINTISDAGRVNMFGPETIVEIKDNYIKTSGGFEFTYDKKSDSINTDSAMFTPPFTKYSSKSSNDAFGVNPDDYKAKSQTVTGSTVPEGGLFTKAEAFTAAQYIVKQELVSPSSAKFCKVTEATATFNSTTGKWTVKGWVESKNTYGTVIRQNFTAVFKPVKKNGDIGYNSGTALLY